MKVIITGATGAIGMALIERCLLEGAEVTVICREDSVRIGRLNKFPQIRVVKADISELLSVAQILSKDYDVFYHLAWKGTTGASRQDMYLQNQNITYTLDAVSLAKALGCHTFIGAGSQAEYGRCQMPLTEKTPAFPENGYGIAKLAAGQMSREMCKSLGIRHIWTRILSVYGPYDGEGSMVMSAVQKLTDHKETAFSAGGQIWDYLYSKDAAMILYRLSVLYRLSESGKDGSIYCIGSGEGRPLKDYIKDIRDAVMEKQGILKTAENFIQDEELGFGKIPYGEKQVMYLKADMEWVKDTIGDMTFVPFKEGIRKMIMEH